jgi:nucleoside-diphosphate-sugar epimerase
MKTALITGVSGYLGGHVARRMLADGWRVVALVRPGSQLTDDLDRQVARASYDGTLSSIQAAFASASVDVVVHLASAVVANHCADQLDPILDANVRLPTQLLEAMRAGSCKRFVNTGTFWQYYNSDNYTPVNLYAAAKQAFEDLALAYVENDGLVFHTLVLFDTYGADDPRRKIMQLLINAIDAPTPLALSPGDQVLDLSHVDDIADAFASAVQRILTDNPGSWKKWRISGTRLPLKQLVELVAQVATMPPNVALGALPYRDREIMIPIDRAIPVLPDWAPRYELVDYIRHMVVERKQSRLTHEY